MTASSAGCATGSSSVAAGADEALVLHTGVIGEARCDYLTGASWTETAVSGPQVPTWCSDPDTGQLINVPNDAAVWQHRWGSEQQARMVVPRCASPAAVGSD